MEGFFITKLSKILVSHKTLTTFCLNKQKSVTFLYKTKMNISAKGN